MLAEIQVLYVWVQAFSSAHYRLIKAKSWWQLPVLISLLELCLLADIVTCACLIWRTYNTFLHDTSYQIALMMDQTIAEFKSECSAETKIKLLLQAVPKCATFSCILWGPNPESEISLVDKDISDIDETIQSWEVVIIELKRP